MKTLIPLLALSLLLATGCDDNPLEAEDTDFSGSYTTTFQFIPTEFGPNGQPIEASVQVEGTGQADFLGTSTVEIEQTVDLTTGQATGTATYTTADGDQLFTENQAMNSPPDPNGRFTFTGSMTITGGTGRFEGATGRADVAGSVDQSTGTGTFSFDGTITF